MKASKIIQHFGNPYQLIEDFEINEIVSIFELKENSLSFIYKENPKYLDYLCGAPDNILLIVPKEFRDFTKEYRQAFVFSDHPKIDFLRYVKLYYYKDHFIDNCKIHSSAIIGGNSQLHSSVKVGPFSIVDDCIIGEGSVIEDCVHIYSRTVIGKNVRIRSGCKIGTDDFGPVRIEDGTVELFPQIGGLIIEDDVDIFPLTAIGKGTLGNTVIKRGVKIDHQCQIGHNVVIGENTVLTAQVVVCGSCKIGKNSYLGAKSIIRNEFNIGDNVLVGMGSVVTKSFGDNLLIIGNPARIVKALTDLIII